MKRGSRISFSYPASKTLKHHHLGVAVFTGISGSFEMEWVAAFGWNWWQLWTGIRNALQGIKNCLIDATPPVLISKTPLLIP